MFLCVQVYMFFVKDYDSRVDIRYMNETPVAFDAKTKEIAQDFSTPGTLSRLDIMMANYKIKPKSGWLRLGIFQGPRCLFLKNFPASEVEDNRFYSFRIEPKNNETIPKGKYRLTLNYLPGNPTDRLAVWVSQSNLYPYGKLYVNKKPQNGDITFRIYFHSSLWGMKNRWLFPPSGSFFSHVARVTGFLLLLFMVNCLFYYFWSRFLKGNE